MRLLKPQIGGDDESAHGWHWAASDRNKVRYFNGLFDSQLAQQDQHQQHDQNYPTQSHAGMAHAIAIAAKTASEAAEEENYQDDDEYRSKRHRALPQDAAGAPQTAPRPGAKHIPGRESSLRRRGPSLRSRWLAMTNNYFFASLIGSTFSGDAQVRRGATRRRAGRFCATAPVRDRR